MRATSEAVDGLSRSEARIVRARQRGRLGRLLDGLVGSAYPLGMLTALVILWQIAVMVLRTPDYLLPAPDRILGEAINRFPLFVSHGWITALETILGFLLSVAIGVPLAIAIASWRTAERTAYPLLVASQTIPKIAIAPLLIAWLGFGLAPKVMVAFLLAVFPIVISTVVGLKAVPLEMIYLGRSMGLSWLGMFVKISLPSALPSIFGGFKVAITLAIVGAVVGEFIGADKGLGYLLIVSVGQINATRMFAELIYLTATGVLFFAVVEFFERLAIPWHISTRTDGIGARPQH